MMIAFTVGRRAGTSLELDLLDKAGQPTLRNDFRAYLERHPWVLPLSNRPIP